jgi:valyl-tRNA synthetase
MEIPKAYNPAEKEAQIYKEWEDKGFFKPIIREGVKPFTIIMPPPNANDNLHIGHARFVYIEDILTRYWRMKGRPTLWAPGADHAGIETQYVFEKKLAKEGKSRFDYDQDTLYKMIWQYVAENRTNMENQLRVLGASCDWSRSKFTLDPDIIKIVYRTFKKLSDDNMVYRGERVVNFCVKCGTAFSQLEVNYDEREDKLYHLDYGTITIATTRPETIFADVAIAVNPKDKKYKNSIGKIAVVPLIGREIPIISDKLVEIGFGTGALKITPAHDATDFEIGQNHNLPIMSIIGKNGRLENVPEEFTGLKPLPARELAIKRLEEAGLLVKVEPLKHSVGVCYRCNTVIEPLLEKQWFIAVEKLAEGALEAIENKKVKFAAKKYEKTAIHWLTDLKDWNISRQITWGIRIPAWHCESCDKWTITDGSVPSSCSHCKSDKIVQDKDTFDTWFSSGQWPFALLEANSKKDLEYFYPTSVMETGFDIIFFWVVRMIMLGVYTTGDIPFEDVLIHGLVRDKNGIKISKSKGNVINPVEMVEKYGSDALRMSLVWGALIENDVSISEDKIKGQKFFANKVWNASRFVLMNLEDYKNVSRETIEKKLTKEDHAILSGYEELVTSVSNNIEIYKLNIAAEDLYSFFWHEYCDIYIENAKVRIRDNAEDKVAAQYTLDYVLNGTLRLLHPFMPFVTEEIWANLEQEKQLIVSDWPTAKK